MALTVATIGVVLATVCLPLTALGPAMSFTSLPRVFLPTLVVIVALYLASAEIAKRVFYGRCDSGTSSRPSVS